MASMPLGNPLGSAIKLFQAGRLSEARLHCSLVLRRQPKNFDALYLMGVINEREGKLDEATIHFRKALAVKPRSFDVLLNLGITELKLGRYEAAIDSTRKAITASPSHALAHDVSGMILAETGQHEAAVASFQKALSIAPGNADVHMHLGSVLLMMGRFEHAVTSLQAALAINPKLANAHHVLGASLMALRRHSEAVIHLQKALAIDPRLMNAHRDLGLALRELGQHDMAIASFRAGLAINPHHPSTLNALGNTLKQLRSYDSALTSYQRVLDQDPDDPNALSMSAFLRRMICDWDGIDQIEGRLIENVRNDRAAIMPFPFLAVTDDMADQRRCAQKYWNRRNVTTMRSTASIRRTRGDKLRIGYLSADFHAHATAYLMAQLFEEHDRSRFEVFGFSDGPDDGSPMRQRLMSAFDHFIDLREDSSDSAARRIAGHDIDILVDLKGHTEFARLEILAERPAPVQAHYIGYPGTLGTDFVDYMIVDPIVVRPDESIHFTERLVYLPTCYQVNDRNRPRGATETTRASCSLPDKGFVFCNFNNSYKITPSVFDVWMRLVKAIPGSVFWLLSDNEWADENLRREAQARGVPPDRLVFAPRLRMDEHLGRHRLADLFLDTFPYNAHTTGSDALWAGLPVLTLAGQSFASRVAASLLHAVGLPELIVHDVAEYERVALELATDQPRLADLWQRLERNLETAPLFDVDGMRRNLETAYVEMWTTHSRGEAPKSFHVAG